MAITRVADRAALSSGVRGNPCAAVPLERLGGLQLMGRGR